MQFCKLNDFEYNKPNYRSLTIQSIAQGEKKKRNRII